MTYGNDHPPTKTPDVTGTIVLRPRHTDAIGKALASAFGPARTMPMELELALGKLDSIQ